MLKIVVGRLLSLALALAVVAFAPTQTSAAEIDQQQARVAANERFSIVRADELHRFQDRPYARIPYGAAFWVKAPRGVTETDLHGLIRSCQATYEEAYSPLCVAGSTVEVTPDGALYRVRLTSADRGIARAIQARVKKSRSVDPFPFTWRPGVTAETISVQAPR